MVTKIVDLALRSPESHNIIPPSKKITTGLRKRPKWKNNKQHLTHPFPKGTAPTLDWHVKKHYRDLNPGYRSCTPEQPLCFWLPKFPAGLLAHTASLRLHVPMWLLESKQPCICRPLGITMLAFLVNMSCHSRAIGSFL
ncbi:UNVERIFIED_CONTAM: hypothetical protein K2H54_024681 [Gekko kuhli]